MRVPRSALQPGLFGEPERPDRGVRPVRPTEGVEQLAAELPSSIYLGTSSWSFPGWRGIVWDGRHSKQRLAREGLRAYARHPLLRAVGIDRTYYAPVSAEIFAEYAVQVPEHFRFVVKAHEDCTVPRFPAMDRYGDRAGRRNARFLDPHYTADEVVAPYVEGLADRAGLLLFQFSPMDPAPLGGASGFADRLHGFLDALPRGPSYAVEIRTAALFGTDYLDALDSAGAVHCLNVHPSMPPVGRQDEATGDCGAAVLLRWMLHSGYSYEAARRRYDPFDRIVDEDLGARGSIAAVCIKAAARGRLAFVIANNKAEGSAPLSVLRLAEAIVRGRGRD